MTGILEAIYHRVPIVGIANFADQVDNVVRIQDKGLGVAVSKHELSDENVYDAIQEVLRNERYVFDTSSPNTNYCLIINVNHSEIESYFYSYRKEVNRIADIWQDQPRQPIDEATYWLELLIKYKNFDHWKINDFHLNFFQYFSVDVIIFLVFSFCFPLYLSILYLRTYYGTTTSNK